MAGTENGTSPFWSPDSRYIAFVADRKLKKISIAGGAETTLTETPALPLPGAWGRDGSILFSVGQIGATGIARISQSGGAVTPVGTPRDGFGDILPQFLPDGRHFLYVSSKGPAGIAELYAGSLDGGPSVHIRSSGAVNGVMDAAGRYAAPGYLLFLKGGVLMAQRFDEKRLILTGDPVAVAEHAGPFSVSAQETLVYRPIGAQAGVSGTQQVVWIDRAGNLGPYVWMPGIFQGLRLSPERLRLALGQSIEGNSDVWVIHLGRGISNRLTFDASADINPIWSPDGTRIVFSSSRLGPFRMFFSSPGGSSDQPLASETPSGMQDIAEDWSPDGKYIVFCRYPPGSPDADIWVKPLFGDRKPFPFVQSKSFIDAEPRVSPDGRWLAYTTNESGMLQIVVQTFPHPTLGKFVLTAVGGVYPNWSRYGQELYYLALDGKLMAVPVKDDGNALDFGEPIVLFQSPLTVPILPGASPYDVSADSKRFAFIVNTTNPAGRLTTVRNWTAALHREVKKGTEDQALERQITDRKQD